MCQMGGRDAGGAWVTSGAGVGEVEYLGHDAGELEVLRGVHGRDPCGEKAGPVLLGDDATSDAGMEVVYQGIRLTPEQIVAVARDEDVDVVGLSILSGSHLEIVPEVVRLLRAEGVDAPVVAGGIIPEEDRPRLLAAGVAAVYTPKDFELARIMSEILDLADAGTSR